MDGTGTFLKTYMSILQFHVTADKVEFMKAFSLGEEGKKKKKAYFNNPTRRNSIYTHLIILRGYLVFIVKKLLRLTGNSQQQKWFVGMKRQRAELR